MDRQPKTEPGSPPGFRSSNHRNLNNMTIRELVSVLRAAFRIEDFDRVEEILVSRDERLNAEIGQLREKVEMETLTRFHAEEEFRKREELCEKGKRLQESYEMLLKNVKISGLGDIDALRKKNGELEREVNELRKLKEKWVDDSNAIAELRKKNGELECEVCKLRKLNEKWVSDSNALAELRSRVRVLEDDKNASAALRIKNGDLEKAVTKNLAIIGELRNENRKLVNEKREIEIVVESLNGKFRELHGRVARLEDDTKLLMSVDAYGGGNNEWKPPVDPGVSTFQDKDEEDVGDYEFGKDAVEPLQKNEDSRHSLGVAGTAHPPNKGSKDAQGASSATGCLELEKDIEIIDLDDEDDDDDEVSRRMLGKKELSRINVKNEHPSSSVAIQQKSIFANAQLDMIKRKISFSDTDTSTSSSSSDDLKKLVPLSFTLLQPKRRKT